MNERHIFANNDMAIISQEDGALLLMPKPILDEAGQDRDAIQTGSDGGKKTFRPGVGSSLLLRVASDGPIQVHARLPEAVRSKIGEVLDEHCQSAYEEVLQLLEDNLTPKQKETDDGRDE